MNIRLLSQCPSEAIGILEHTYLTQDGIISGFSHAMDPAVQRLLNDKLYDKRKQGALEFVIVRPPLNVNTAYEASV